MRMHARSGRGLDADATPAMAVQVTGPNRRNRDIGAKIARLAHRRLQTLLLKSDGVARAAARMQVLWQRKSLTVANRLQARANGTKHPARSRAVAQSVRARLEKSKVGGPAGIKAQSRRTGRVTGAPRPNANRKWREPA